MLTLIYSIGQGACPTEEYMQRLAAKTWLRRLFHLQLFESDLLPAPARAPAGSPHLTNLRTIEFTDSGIPAEAIADLALAPAIRWLEKVELPGWFLAGDNRKRIRAAVHRAVNAALRTITSSPRSSFLQVLHVGAVGVGPDGADAILASPHLTALKELFLEGAHLVPAQTRRALRQRFGENVRFTGADGYIIE